MTLHLSTSTVSFNFPAFSNLSVNFTRSSDFFLYQDSSYQPANSSIFWPFCFYMLLFFIFLFSLKTKYAGVFPKYLLLCSLFYLKISFNVNVSTHFYMNNSQIYTPHAWPNVLSSSHHSFSLLPHHLPSSSQHVSINMHLWLLFSIPTVTALIKVTAAWGFLIQWLEPLCNAGTSVWSWPQRIPHATAEQLSLSNITTEPVL